MSPRPLVLAYHGVAVAGSEDRHNLLVHPAAFREQMAWLARTGRVVPLEQMPAAIRAGGPSPIALTFDDALVSVLDNAIPVLARLRLPATLFVPTGWLGRAAGWLDDPSGLTVMSEAQLRDAVAAGMVLESHGHLHIDMRTARPDDIRHDLASSIEVLRSLTDRRPRYLAYPFGRSSRAAREEAARQGFEAAFSIDEPGRERFRYERTQITPLDGMNLFRLKATGRYLTLRNDPVISSLYEAVRPVLGRLRERVAG